MHGPLFGSWAFLYKSRENGGNIGLLISKPLGMRDKGKRKTIQQKSEEKTI